MKEAFASEQPKVKSQTQIVKDINTASHYHSSCSEEWYTYQVVIIKSEGVSSQHHFTGCSGRAGEVQEPERREQDNPRLPKNRPHQSRTACCSSVFLEESTGYSSLERKECRRALQCQQFGGADSCSTHNLQCCIWNTTASSECPPEQETLVYWSESWERPLRWLKDWRFCHMRRNQASRDCLAVKRENLWGWGWNSLHVNISTSIWLERAKMMETFS